MNVVIIEKTLTFLVDRISSPWYYYNSKEAYQLGRWVWERSKDAEGAVQINSQAKGPYSDETLER